MLVESVLVGRGVEGAVALDEVESLGAVELLALESPEFDGVGSLVDAVGLEPEPAVGADEPTVGAAVGAGTGVALTLPAGAGVEFGAAADAAGGGMLLSLSGTGTAGIAAVAGRWIATG